MVTNFNYYKDELRSFIHPVSNHIIEDNNDYVKRKQTCDLLFEKTGLECFIFRNQSYSQLANDLFEYTQGKQFLKSTCISEDVELFNTFRTKPLIANVFKDFNIIDYEKENLSITEDDWSEPIKNKIEIDEEHEHVKGNDVANCYSTAVLNNKDDYPIYSGTDFFINRPEGYKYSAPYIKCGEYLIDHVVLNGLGGIYLPKIV